MATTGKLMVNVFDGGRKPWHGPEIRLVLTDPFTASSNKKIADERIEKGKSSIFIEGIPTDAGQRYILFVDAENHRSHSVFPVKAISNTVTPLNIMLIRNNPVPDFSSFSYDELKLKSPRFHGALSTTVPESDFLNLSKSDTKFGLARMATLLNIEAKLRATELKQDKAIEFLRSFEGVNSLERDRLKVAVAEEMPVNVRGLKAFTELNEALNELNHKGFPISFKEKVAFCSLQLSFAKKAQKGIVAADIDIDLLTDVGHFGEVIKNKIMRMKTDPFTIYVLLFDQGIRPLYTLKV